LLTRHDRCSIHDQLDRRGFSGCVSYDCYGAGQRVTRRFAGVTWRGSPERAHEIFETFRKTRIAHELMAMLTIALERCADDGVRAELRARLRAIDTWCEDASNRPGAEIVTLRRELLRELSRGRTPLDK
jgi:hypothetical protein